MHSRPRGALGPLIVAAGVWCASGVLSVASPDSASHRLVLPAPWWHFAAAFVLAWLVPAWRQRPFTALPALLATVPWWPIPLPSLGLIWTGPLAWMLIGVSIACALGSGPIAALGRAVHAGDARRSTALAGVLTFLVCGAAAWNVGTRVPGGDEPHYLVIAQSLLKDHDLRIENNHRQRDYAQYYGGDIAPHYVQRGSDGEIYSIHAPGLPALVLPAFAVFGYRGAQIVVLLLAAVTGGLIWRIGWRVTDDATAAWFAWAALAGSATFVLHGFTLFPDGPGALIIAAAVMLLVHLERTPATVGARAIIAVSALLAALPWLHTRFSVLAAGMGLLIVVWLLQDSSRSFSSRRTRAALFLVVPALSAASWFAFFQIVYGTPDPTAPYGGGAGTRAAFIPGGLAGLFFDQQFGLAMYTPILMSVGVWLARSRQSAHRPLALGALAITAAYLAAVATYWLWWAGTPSSPGRFTLAVLPMLAMPLAQLWNGADADRRRVFLAVLAVSVAITCVVAGVNEGAIAWNMRDAQGAWLEWLGPVVNLPRAWPSFFWKLDPSRLSTEVPFFVHAGVWVAVFAGGWLVVRRLGPATPATRRVIAGAWLLGGVMLAAQAGWWLNGVSGLDASRSQATVLAASGPVVALGPFQIRPRADVSNALIIRAEEAGRLEGTRPWLFVHAAPAGTYSLRISTPRPKGGELVVMAGRRGGAILRSIQLDPIRRQTARFELPVGVTALRVVPSRGLAGIEGTIDLVPEQVARGSTFANLVMPYGPVRVYFFDENVHAESEGFWVRGGQSAALAVVAAAGQAAPSVVTLQNGRGGNDVVLDVDGVVTRERFASFETRRFDLPSAIGARHLTITSTSGFRPSADGTSSDNRYLGVFVKIGS